MRISFVLLWLGTACGGASGAFSATFPDNRPDHLQVVLDRLERAPPSRARPLALGVRSEPTGLFAVDLATGDKLWEQAADPLAAPYVAGDLVVVHERTAVRVRDLADGRTLTSFEPGALHLVGAGGEGRLVALTLSTGGAVGARSRLIVVDGGRVLRDFEVDHALGAPTLHAGMIFVPWASQNVSVLDVQTGKEIARIRLDSVVGHAFADSGSIYFGHTGVYRLTSAIRSGSHATAAFAAPDVGELPGRPTLLDDAYSPVFPPDSAIHRIRLEGRPVAHSENLTFTDDTVYLVFYRLIFGLDPQDGAVRWAQIHEGFDVVGAAAIAGGIILADESGALRLLDASTGMDVWSAQLGTRTSAVRVRPGTFDPPREATPEAPSVADQLLRAAQIGDARLVPGRQYAISQLAALPNPMATAHLVALCEDRRAPSPVGGAACNALAERTTGEEHVLEALERHAAYLQDTSAPPVTPLAMAAARMRSERAVPLLIAHLKDPATPAEALPAVLAALEELGAEAATEPVRRFLLLYHADAPDEHLVRALERAVKALVTLEGSVAAEALELVAKDPLALAEARAAAQKALAALEAEAATDEEAETSTDEGAAEEEGEENAEAAEEGGEAETEAELPMRITHRIVDQVLAPVENDLKTCLLADRRRPTSARLVLALDGDGSIAMLSVTPRSVSQCIGNLVRSQKFPGNRQHRRQQIIYTIRR